MSLPRHTQLRSYKRINPVNKKRKARLFKEDFHSAEFREWIAGWPCAICGVGGFSDPAHITSRGAGGKAEGNIVPLCCDRPSQGVTGCHTLLDCYPWKLPCGTERKLRTLAKRLWKAFQKHNQSTED